LVNDESDDFDDEWLVAVDLVADDEVDLDDLDDEVSVEEVDEVNDKIIRHNFIRDKILKIIKIKI